MCDVYNVALLCPKNVLNTYKSAFITSFEALHGEVIFFPKESLRKIYQNTGYHKSLSKT